MSDLVFRQPGWLWALLLLPLLVAHRTWLLRRRRRAVPYPPSGALEGLGGRNPWFPWISSGLLLGALACMVLALARPAVRTARATVVSEGVAIMMVLDVSGSMVAEDFKPNNRIDVARSVLSDFVRKRASDRLGLITFAAMPFLRCPLTLDHKTLRSIVEEVKAVNRPEIDGTAIGDALVAAGKRLLSAPEKSRVVILLTDGENNRGQFDPLQAAQLLAAHKIRVDVVGIGSTGVVPYPVPDQNGRKSYQFVHIGFNEPALKAIAKTTDGVYYNASDTSGLQRVFDAIDHLERSKIASPTYVRYRELFVIPLGLAFLLLSAEALWRTAPGRRLP
jgi:Ca-activated chloride channel family protein